MVMVCILFSPEQQKKRVGDFPHASDRAFCLATSGQTEYPPHRSMWSATHTHSSDGEFRQDVTDVLANHDFTS
jgi:hypothetical protein